MFDVRRQGVEGDDTEEGYLAGPSFRATKPPDVENGIEEGDPVKTPTQSTVENDTSPHPLTRTPLPKLQLLVLFYVQLAEPIASTVIYPFVNQLVRETGITKGDERKTGYFAGTN
jgi:hypothetical protein